MSVVAVWPAPDDRPLDTEALVSRYPRLDEPALRVNFVSSLDGAVTLDGVSGGLSGPGDKQVFGVLRMVCDALVVAAGTVRTEKYDALRLGSFRREWRLSHGLSEFPIMVVVSRSLDLDPAQEVFSDAPVRPVVLTCAAAPAERRTKIAQVADVITVGDDTVDLAAGTAELRRRGAGQVLCEGGPRLFAALTAADLVDELCLTVSPMLVAGDAGRISAGTPGPPREMSLRHILRDGDMLMLRYGRKI